MHVIPNIYFVIPLTPNIASDDGAARLCDSVFEDAAKEYVSRGRGVHNGAAHVTVLVSLVRRINALEIQVLCARPRMLAAFQSVLDSISGFGQVDSIREARAQPYRVRLARLERLVPYGLEPAVSLDWQCLVASEHRFTSPLTAMSTDELLRFLGKVAHRKAVRLAGDGVVSNDPDEHRLLRLLAPADREEAVDAVLARIEVGKEHPQSWRLRAHAASESIAG